MPALLRYHGVSSPYFRLNSCYPSPGDSQRWSLPSQHPWEVTSQVPVAGPMHYSMRLAMLLIARGSISLSRHILGLWVDVGSRDMNPQEILLASETAPASCLPCPCHPSAPSASSLFPSLECSQGRCVVSWVLGPGPHFPWHEAGLCPTL